MEDKALNSIKIEYRLFDVDEDTDTLFSLEFRYQNDDFNGKPYIDIAIEHGKDKGGSHYGFIPLTDEQINNLIKSLKLIRKSKRQWVEDD